MGLSAEPFPQFSLGSPSMLDAPGAIRWQGGVLCQEGRLGAPIVIRTPRAVVGARATTEATRVLLIYCDCCCAYDVPHVMTVGLRQACAGLFSNLDVF